MKIKKITALLMVAALGLAGCNAGASPSGSQAQEPATSSETASPTEAAPLDAEDDPSSEEPAEAVSEVLLKVAGSTSVAPLMKELKTGFEAANGHVSVEIQESGSSAGITATIEGAADMGMSSRDLKEEEIAEGLEYVEIALDGIAVIVHPDNQVAGLTQEQIAGIYKGEITNWADVGGESADIIVVSREEGSGTRGAFEELLKIEGEVTGDGIFENSTGGVKSNVAGSKNAIGYISLGSLDATVAALEVDGAACSVETVKDKSYPIARPFLVCTKGSPADAVQELINYILSEEGQEIVVENNYITVL